MVVDHIALLNAFVRGIAKTYGGKGSTQSTDDRVRASRIRR